MNNDLKKVGLVFRADGSSDFIESLKEINSQLNMTRNQFKITQAQWDSSTSSTDKLKDKLDNLNKVYELQQQKVSVLRSQLEELKNAEEKDESAIRKKTNQLTQAEVQLQKYQVQIKETTSQLNSMRNKLEGVTSTLDKVGDSFSKAGKKVSVYSGLVAGGFAASTKAAIDFESAFAGVEKTVDGTTEQMDNLKQGIRDMAKVMPASTTEISAVAEAAGQLGIATDDILSFTKVMIDLGESTNLSADEAASSLAKFANIMNTSSKDYSRLGATIVDLGNNFATTEADIVSMSMRIAGAGKTIGLTETDVLALATSLSSVGIEAEMGGSAISKAMIKMAVAVEEGNGQLEEFAKVAGMSTDEFKKCFEENAMDAISKFIIGLGNTESAGKSTLAMLSDLGFEEVRLRDTMLRSANASELFTRAIQIGNNAWEDNTALTNEANKRYETLKSKLDITKNKLYDNAITLGNKLMPVVEKVVNQIGKWTEKISQLDDSQLEMILKIGAVVVASGPLITTLGKITSTTSTVIKGFGTFHDALKVAQGTMTSTKDSVNKLASFIRGITSPVGLAVTAIAALGAGLLAYKAATEESLRKTKKFAEEINNSVKAYDELKNAQEEQASNDMKYIDNVQRLYLELKNITDQNGKIKEGYESRAKFIANELKNSLGIEIDLTDNIIKNYEQLQSQIEKTILLKKANILLNLSEDKYKNSLEQQAEAYNNFTTATQKLAEKREELYEATKKLNEHESLKNANKVNNLVEEVKILRQSAKDAERVYNEHLENITNYEEASSIILSENLSDIKDWTNKTQLVMSNNSEEQNNILTSNLEKLTYNIRFYKQLYAEDVKNKDEAGKQANQNQIKNNEESLQLTIDSLLQQTSTINENSTDVINAWTYLAKNNKEAYNNIISTMPDDLKTTIENMIETSDKKSLSLIKIAQTTTDKIGKAFNDVLASQKNTFSNMSQESKKFGLDLGTQSKEIVKQIKFPFEKLPAESSNVMKNAMSPMLQEMQSTELKLYTTATNIANGVLIRLKKAFDIHSPSRKTREIFKNVMLGAEKGIESEEKNLYKQTNNIAGNVLKEFENMGNVIDLDVSKPNISHALESSIANATTFEIDYNKLYLLFLQALNSCKLQLDDEGFVRLIDNRLREVL